MLKERVLANKNDLKSLANIIRTKRNITTNLSYADLMLNIRTSLLNSELITVKGLSTWEELAKNIGKVFSTQKTYSQVYKKDNGYEMYVSGPGLYYINLITNSCVELFNTGTYYKFYETKSGILYASQSESPYNIVSLIEDKAIKIGTAKDPSWFETSKGVVYCKTSNGVYVISNDTIINIISLSLSNEEWFEASNGDIYLGYGYSSGSSSKGLYYINGTTATQLRNDYNWVKFCESCKGEVYVGGASIKYCLFLQKDKVTEIQTRSKIIHMYSSSKGNGYVYAVSASYIEALKNGEVITYSNTGCDLDFSYEDSKGSLYLASSSISADSLVVRIVENPESETYPSPGIFIIMRSVRSMTNFFESSKGYLYISSTYQSTLAMAKCLFGLDTNDLDTHDVTTIKDNLGTVRKIVYEHFYNNGRDSKIVMALNGTTTLYSIVNNTDLTKCTGSGTGSIRTFYSFNNKLFAIGAGSSDAHYLYSIPNDGAMYYDLYYGNARLDAITKVDDSTLLLHANSSPSINQSCLLLKVTENGGCEIRVIDLAQFAFNQKYIEPSGTLDITENGEYDVTNYEKANVTIPIPEGYIKPEGTLDITENGEYKVTDKNFVSVAVPVSSGPTIVVEKVPTWQEIKTNSFINVAVRDFVFESSDGKYRYSSYDNSISPLPIEKGLFRLDLTTGEEVKLHNDYYEWRYFFEASNGDIYIGISASLSTDNRGIFRIRDGVLTQIYTENFGWQYFFEASNGNIYVSSGSSTAQGILLIKDDSVTKIYTTSYSWQYFFEDNAGNIYVSSTKSNTGIVHIKEDIATLAYSLSAKWCYFHLDAKEGVYASSSNSSTGIVYLKDSVGTKIYATGYNWQTSYSRKNGGVYIVHSSYSLLLLQGETATPIEPQLKTLGSFTVEDENGVYIGGGISLTGIYYLQDDIATQIFPAGTAYDLFKTTSGDIYASGYKIPLLHLQNGVATTLSDTTAYNFSRFYEAKNGYTYTSQTAGKFMALKGATAVTLSGGGYKLPNVFEASTGCLYFSCDENNNLGVYKVDGTTSVRVYLGGYNYKYFHEAPNGDIYASSASGDYFMRIRGDEGKIFNAHNYPFPYSYKVGDGLLLCKTQHPQPTKDVCLLIEGDTISHVLLNKTIQRS